MPEDQQRRERPILFSAPMVRAILEKRKTQTRRVANLADNVQVCDGTAKGYLPAIPDGFVIQCPYGQPGDRLWVRETFVIQHDYDGDQPPYDDGRPIEKSLADESIDYPGGWRQAHYRATDSAPDLTCENPEHDGGPCCHWRPSIFMPRWASRITLEITKVRVERVQQISHDDALAEGCAGHDWVSSSPYIAGPHTDAGQLPAEEYRELWDSINAKRGFGWEKNPWVWVVEFKRVTP